jgi:NAD(P)-dependent dehydrogenase (short-subunit alcohol dehydrogenase family)
VGIVEGIDVSSDDAVAPLQAFFATKDDAKIIPMDLLIHNAGAFSPPENFADDGAVFASKSLHNVTMDRMRYGFELNTLGPLRVTQALLPNLEKEAVGTTKVIIITSMMGSISDNTSGGMYGYRTAKAAVNMVGASLAQDLKKQDIAVGLVHPGAVLSGFGGPDGKDRPAEKRWPGQRDV